MAKMYPEITLDDRIPKSESVVYQILDEKAPDDWEVIYSQWFRQPDHTSPREIDFLVFIPGCEIIAIEAKQGAYNSRDPDHQVITAMMILKGILKKNTGYKGWFECAVTLTDREWPVNQRQPACEFYGPDLLDTLVAGLQKQAKVLRDKNDGDPLDKGCITKIRNYLIPKLLEVKDPATEKFLQIWFTEGQYAALSLTEDNPRCLVTGVAGTGKTLLAIKLAKQRADEGEEVLILCRTTLQSKYLRRALEDYTGNVFVHRTGPETKFAVPEREFDYLIVDEAHTLAHDDVFLNKIDGTLSSWGGLTDGRWTMFIDFTSAVLFEGGVRQTEDAIMNNIKKYCLQPAMHKLRVVCRSTRQIADSIERIAPDYDPERILKYAANYYATKYIYWRNEDEIETILSDYANRVAEFGESSDTIVLWIYGNKNPRVKQNWKDILEEKGIEHDSTARLQGMEKDYVALVVQPSQGSNRKFYNEYTKYILYEGMSRARLGLTVITPRSFKEILEP